MTKSVGETMKSIRVNKGYSQKFVSEGALTQSSYSKFELSRIDILSTSYISILNRLNMTHEEFFYIKNNYNYSAEELFLKKFFSQPFNHSDVMKSLVKDAEALLLISDNILVADIKCICEALIVLNETNDIRPARDQVEQVWERLSKYDNWYLNDIKLINTILFIFPIETAEKIAERVLARLKKYNYFQDTHKLKINIELNLSLLLIKSHKYTSALKVIEEAVTSCKLHGKYRQLAICYARKGICLNISDTEESKLYIDKSIEILRVLEEEHLKERLIEEIRHYIYN